MENNVKPKLGAGIITVSVIQLVLSGFAIFSYVLVLVLKDAIQDQIAAMGQSANLPSDQLMVHSFISFAIIVGVILILTKKSAGVYVYFATAIFNVIYSIATGGFRVSTVIFLLILPVLMAVFVSQKKEVFGFGTRE